MKKCFLTIAVVISFLLVLNGCGGQSLYSQKKFYLGSIFDIRFYYKSNREGRRRADRIFIKVFDTLQQMDAKLNPLNPISELSSVNGNASFSSVQVSSEFYNLLSKSIKASILTDGAFDITLAPLIEYVGLSGGKISKTKVKEVLRRTGPNVIKLDAHFNKVQFSLDGVKVNLSRIQRGYAIDQVVRVLKQNRVKKAYIKAGRTVYILGSRRNWSFAVPDPLFPDKTLNKIKVRNKGIAYASVSEEFFKNINYWAPLINKDYPQESYPLEAVVIAPNAVTAEVLSDALMVLGQEKGLALIDKLSYRAMVIVKGESDKYIFMGSKNLIPKQYR